MRKILTKDIPAACRFIKHPMVLAKIKEIAQNANTLTDVQDVWGKGFDIFAELLGILGDEDAAKALFEFAAGPFEITPEQVEELEISELVPMVKQLFRENDVLGFFGTAAASVSKA